MNKKEKISLFKVFMNKDTSSELEKVLHSGFIGQGTKVEEFEKKLSLFFDNENINTVNSATSGIHVALHVIKLLSNDNRDEVITTPLTCVATNSPIIANNLKIKWADVDKKNFNIDLDDVIRKINKKTLALIVVHWGGHPCNKEKIEEIKERYKKIYKKNLYVIEDCAHAFGSKFKKQNVANSKNICVFSFQAIKHLTTGDGGAVASPTKEIHEMIKLLRWYGLDRTKNKFSRSDQNIEHLGYKFHMNDIAATIGLCNLKSVDCIVKKHNDNYNWFNERLCKIKKIQVVPYDENIFSSSWIMTISVEDREKFMSKLKQFGIESSQVHYRNDKNSCFSKYKCLLPNLDIIENKMCCIPCGWWITEEDRQYIYNVIEGGWR